MAKENEDRVVLGDMYGPSLEVSNTSAHIYWPEYSQMSTPARNESRDVGKFGDQVEGKMSLVTN